MRKMSSTVWSWPGGWTSLPGAGDLPYRVAAAHHGLEVGGVELQRPLEAAARVGGVAHFHEQLPLLAPRRSVEGGNFKRLVEGVERPRVVVEAQQHIAAVDERRLVG